MQKSPIFFEGIRETFAESWRDFPVMVAPYFQRAGVLLAFMVPALLFLNLLQVKDSSNIIVFDNDVEQYDVYR